MEQVTISIIDSQYKSGHQLVSYLRGKQELALANEAENNFSKNILLSVASYFEKEITELVMDFAKSHSAENILVVSIIRTKAVKRQYHTYFTWDGPRNANSFFALWGEDFKNNMIAQVKKDSELEKSIVAFLELGQERNKLVHQNYAEIVLDKTADEIYALYKTALLFISTMKRQLIKEV